MRKIINNVVNTWWETSDIHIRRNCRKHCRKYENWCHTISVHKFNVNSVWRRMNEPIIKPKN